MDFDLTPDQSALQSAIDQLLARHKDYPTNEAVHYFPGDAVERDLEAGGYYDIAREEGMGASEAALLIGAVAQLPWCAEVAGTALVAAKLLPAPVPRPVVLARGKADGPLRFLTKNATVLVDCGDEVRVIDASKHQVEPLKTFFAYPFGAFVEPPDLSKAPVVPGVTGAALRQWWQLGLVAEIEANARVAVDMSVEYLKNRRQFNRPIGSFQALQHRVSECVVLIDGMRALLRRAAWSGDPADAALAATHAQEPLTRIIYDTQQFHGAMGITLEHPLHLWTYRLRVLQGELGGVTAQAMDAASLIWGD